MLVLFGTMTRWEPSVLRASAMAGIAMAATFLGRPVPASRVLLASRRSALLVADPFLVHSVGFLLSCGAAAGIVLARARARARIPGPRVVGDALGVTAAAQIGVRPVLLPVFGTCRSSRFPANLLAAPLVGPLTVWGLVAGVAGGWLGPGSRRVAPAPDARAAALGRDRGPHSPRPQPLAIDGRASAACWRSAAWPPSPSAAAALPQALGARRTRAGRLDRDAAVPPR